MRKRVRCSKSDGRRGVKVIWTSIVTAVCTLAFPTSGQTICPDARVLISQSPAEYRYQRADWAIPDALLLSSLHFPQTFRLILQAVGSQTPLFVLGVDDQVSTQASADWPKNTRFIEADHESSWVRDFGPLQVMTQQGVVYQNFLYYTARPKDDSIPQIVAETLNARIEHFDIELEGGALISNGQGLCVITSYSLDETNLELRQQDQIDWFLSNLGCLALAVIPPLEGETTGHADITAQFLGPELVAISSIETPLDSENAQLLEDATRVIHLAAASLNLPLRSVRVPMFVDGALFYSYVNSLRVANTYLVPSYSSVPEHIERAAHSALKTALSGLNMVTIVADETVVHGGALHCMALGLTYPK